MLWPAGSSGVGGNGQAGIRRNGLIIGKNFDILEFASFLFGCLFGRAFIEFGIVDYPVALDHVFRANLRLTGWRCMDGGQRGFDRVLAGSVSVI